MSLAAGSWVPETERFPCLPLFPLMPHSLQFALSGWEDSQGHYLCCLFNESFSHLAS